MLACFRKCKKIIHLFSSGKAAISSSCGFTRLQGWLDRQVERQTKHEQPVVREMQLRFLTLGCLLSKTNRSRHFSCIFKFQPRWEIEITYCRSLFLGWFLCLYTLTLCIYFNDRCPLKPSQPPSTSTATCIHIASHYFRYCCDENDFTAIKCPTVTHAATLS